MATFLVFESGNGGRTQSAAERVVFVREKFSWPAFIFTPFWLLRHRLWLWFIVWLVVFIGIMWIGGRLGFGPYAGLAASFFPSLLIGMEAASLRARKLARRGFREAGVVVASNLETAERRFFETWKENSPAPETPNAGAVKTDYPYPPASAPPAQPQSRMAVASDTGIIGLFPNPGAPR